MTKEIQLTQGKVALVDDEDYEWLIKMKWCLSDERGMLYAQRRDGALKRPVKMHRIIMNPPSDMQIDHINGNGLDNRRCNLRIVTNAQNRLNQKVRKDNVSGYKGVTFDKSRNNYQVSIKRDNVERFLGRYKDPLEAARAYDAAAKELFGEYARLNFPND